MCGPYFDPHSITLVDVLKLKLSDYETVNPRASLFRFVLPRNSHVRASLNYKALRLNTQYIGRGTMTS